MILMKDDVRVALVTTHLPVSRIAESITKELIEEKLQILNHSLKRDFALDNPRIAVLSLNPHCGDGGLIGTEERNIICPAIDGMMEKGIKCFGPYAADGFFGSGNYKMFDAVLAMYHDQGLAPFKALAMDEYYRLYIADKLGVISVDNVVFLQLGFHLANIRILL